MVSRPGQGWGQDNPRGGRLVRRVLHNRNRAQPLRRTLRTSRPPLGVPWPHPCPGLDTTFYLGDYTNWSNTQLEAAIGQPNYRLTNESWLEQRSYIPNAVANLAPGARPSPPASCVWADVRPLPSSHSCKAALNVRPPRR